MQDLAHHTRFDPPFHFFLIPVVAITFLVSIYEAWRHPDPLHFWLIVFAAALVVMAFKERLYALKVQDRVIRLEERLRLAALLPESLRPRIPELSESQLIALRFASDTELPALAAKALDAKLAGPDIKKAIQSWRPDEWRV